MSQLLEFVRFKNIPNWSLSHFSNINLIFNKNFKSVKLKEVLSKTNIEWVVIEDNKKYPILGVHAQGQGVFINRVSLGKELTMKKYQKSKAYHLYYCKVRTVKGQWGIVYPEFENSYGSSNMQYLEINLMKLVPEYLELLLRIKKLTDIWDKNAIGADGRHFNLSTLLNLKIPLPPLEIQKKIIQSIKQYELELEDLKRNFKILLDKFNQSIFTNVEKDSNLLNFINFNKLHNWSVQNLSENNFYYNQNYKLEKIGSFLARDKTQTNIDDETLYTRVTIRTKNQGVKIRDTEIGKHIGTKKQYIIKKGQFLLSKIDARNGAFGIATDELDGAIITADFFAYDIDKSKINPYFLSLITTTKQFIQFAQNSSTGTTNRQRLNEKLFLNVEIPLPTIKEQRELVKDLEKNILNQNMVLEKKNLAFLEFEKEIFNND